MYEHRPKRYFAISLDFLVHEPRHGGGDRGGLIKVAIAINAGRNCQHLLHWHQTNFDRLKTKFQLENEKKNKNNNIVQKIINFSENMEQKMMKKNHAELLSLE